MTDKPSASELAWEAYKESHTPEEVSNAKFYYADNREYFKAGYDAAVKEMLRGNLQILGFSVEQIEQLKSFFEMQTGMKPNEFGGSLIDNLVKDNAALTKEVAELEAERESHFALEESVLRELKAERDGFKGWVQIFDYNKGEHLDEHLCPKCRPKIKRRR